MSDDYKVDGLSNAQIREFGKRARKHLGFADAEFIQVLDLESVAEIWTVQGPKPFRLEVVPDADLPDDSGLTTYDGSRIITRIPRRIRHDAHLGHGYARFTIPHELGHGTLHLKQLLQGASMPRRRLGNVKPDWIPKYQSAEHQAMVFAAAFLINDDIARRLGSADDIAVQFGLSLEAARIYFEQMLEERERPAAAARVMRMAAEFRASVAEVAKPEIPFLTDPCLVCGQQKVFPIGHKFMCQACGKIRLADVFVADLTFIQGAGKRITSERACPNPNVLLEYGYALHALGEGKIIGVLNEAHGSSKDLPFDLNHRRWPIRFTLAPGDASEKEQQKKTLKDSLKNAIRGSYRSSMRNLRRQELRSSPSNRETVLDDFATLRTTCAYPQAKTNRSGLGKALTPFFALFRLAGPNPWVKWRHTRLRKQTCSPWAG
jgi:IrrE N-terminal-like domain